nr:protein rep [Paenibacillus periandrae]
MIEEFTEKAKKKIPRGTATYDQLANKIKFCNWKWEVNKYEQNKLKELIKTNLCNDKFCNNCKKVKQAARMAKFMPKLDKYRGRMYQITLTVPNVREEKLIDSIKSMFKAFATLIEYLKLKKKIAGITDKYLIGLDYQGALRSLEITYKDVFDPKKGEWVTMYHPHIHAILVLDGFVPKKKRVTNDYSYHLEKKTNKKVLRREFTKLEEVIQKIWRILNEKEFVEEKYQEGEIVKYRVIDPIEYINANTLSVFVNKLKANMIRSDIDMNEFLKEKFEYSVDFVYEIYKRKVTKTTIDQMEIGYSCTLDIPRTDKDYIEIFKYLTKSTSGEGKGGEPITYWQFKTLWFALHRCRQIQGYGCLFDVDDNEEITEEDVELSRKMLQIINEESPIQTRETLKEIYENKERYFYFSKKKITAIIKKYNL